MRFIKNIRFTSPYCDKGFTLAEVLIALVVIGVIAAITMTTVMPNIHERVNSQRQANIVYKVTQATNLMKANGAMVDGFASTDAFVDELQKYLKIMKRCDSDHIAECWPTKKVRTSDEKEYEVKKAQTRVDLGFKTYKSVKNVGIVLNDGASLIMTYDPTSKGLSIGDKLITQTKALPVGNGYKEFLEYTTNSTAGLAFVMDVNGGKGPNSETIGTKMYDIRNFNTAHFSDCGGKKINGDCYQEIDSYSSLDCSRTNGVLNHPEYQDYCGASSQYEEDYWAGAMKACMDIGATLPDKDTLLNAIKNNRSSFEITLAENETHFHTSNVIGSNGAYFVYCYAKFGCGTANGYGNGNIRLRDFNVICLN